MCPASECWPRRRQQSRYYCLTPTYCSIVAASAAGSAAAAAAADCCCSSCSSTACRLSPGPERLRAAESSPTAPETERGRESHTKVSRDAAIWVAGRTNLIVLILLGHRLLLRLPLALVSVVLEPNLHLSRERETMQIAIIIKLLAHSAGG